MAVLCSTLARGRGGEDRVRDRRGKEGTVEGRNEKGGNGTIGKGKSGVKRREGSGGRV